MKTIVAVALLFAISGVMAITLSQKMAQIDGALFDKVAAALQAEQGR